ncbi:MAG: zinc ribbon domain-containing protein [Congregibacter sp.]|nr:zinc ribbon domain-containing protein [Congregibacter sp.]MDP5070710.1 zinc ribbon domain-containing protein [Congregibacter sp.]
MPIYEYQCTECGELHEALRKISDAPLTDCPACGKPTLRKKVTAAAFRLAGSGWYETDFKKSGNKKNLAGDSASDKPGGSADSAAKAGSEGKSDGAKGSSEAASSGDAKKDAPAKAAKPDAGSSAA